jgi:uncharacterized protein (TIGR03437 family)
MRTLVLTLLALTGTAHAAGTIYSTLLSGSGQDYASAVTSDSQGNTYVAGVTYSPDFPVTPGAWQTTLGGASDAFVAKLGPTGKVIWATYLGGAAVDSATGLALDSSGNVWVTGATVSQDFPLVNPLQAVPGYFSETFVAKLDPSGSKLLYSTYLRGQDYTGPGNIAVDSAGDAYVAVNLDSAIGFPGLPNGPDEPGIVVSKLSPQGALIYSYFHPSGIAAAIAVDSSGAAYVAGATGSFPELLPPITGQAIVFKLSPDGSAKVYENMFGGSYTANANAIAVNSGGEAWVAGTTTSADARPLWESIDYGATWAPLDNLPYVGAVVVDPTTPATLYAACDLGVCKSVNGGSTWTPSSTGIASTEVGAMTVDPVHPQTLYAIAYAPLGQVTTTTTVYKSTDGAESWSAIDSEFSVNQILVDAQNPNIVYESGWDMRKSTDGGTTWSAVPFPGNVVSMVLDPRVSGFIVALTGPTLAFPFGGGGSGGYLYRSVDGGNTWTQITSAPASAPLLVDPSTNPSTFYDALYCRSTDVGFTWTSIPAPPFIALGVSSIALDSSGTLYAAVGDGAIYASHDHGQSWSAIGSPVPSWTGKYGGPTVTAIVPAGSTGTFYAAVSQPASAGFVTKLSADGSTLEYSTYLRGHTSMDPLSGAEEPDIRLLQNWISGIALDPAGNVVLTGGTRATDFPTVNPVQAANAGRADAFAAVLLADGSRLNYATYLGGSSDDGAFAAGIDSSGNIILAGETWSSDFPVAGGLPSSSGNGHAFVAKLAVPATPAIASPTIASVLNGASLQPGIESGSWATIEGGNLANTTRTWNSADFTGENLPTELSGVSVTFDGIPAYISYISPTQINLQVTSDRTVGAVNVVVNNNGALSAPATVQLQAYAPAFFLDPGTNYAIATTLNYAVVGTPAAPVHPGDTIVLWATGFGPTTPPTQAGVEVSGAPATSTLPTVTVGGVNAHVINSVLTDGTAGLYQVAIQLPANVPTGTAIVQASIGGPQSQANAVLFVGLP